MSKQVVVESPIYSPSGNNAHQPVISTGQYQLLGCIDINLSGSDSLLPAAKSSKSWLGNTQQLSPGIFICGITSFDSLDVFAYEPSNLNLDAPHQFSGVGRCAPQDDHLIDIIKVVKLISICKSSIYQKMQVGHKNYEKTFPKPVPGHGLGRRSRWSYNAIVAWISRQK